jgi:ATP-dependent DNA ligase
LAKNSTLRKEKRAVWLRPEAVAQIEFLDGTEGDRLRHSKFGDFARTRIFEA